MILSDPKFETEAPKDMLTQSKQPLLTGIVISMSVLSTSITDFIQHVDVGGWGDSCTWHFHSVLCIDHLFWWLLLGGRRLDKTLCLLVWLVNKHLKMLVSVSLWLWIKYKCVFDSLSWSNKSEANELCYFICLWLSSGLPSIHLLPLIPGQVARATTLSRETRTS